MNRGKFIVFEGLDGSGTTTQIEFLKRYYHEQGVDVLFTHEPTDKEIGRLIRSALQKEWRPNMEALQLLFCADRSQHLSSEIQPALDKGRHVICDRYTYSTLAFGGLSVDVEWLKSISSAFLEPDLTLFFNVPADICLQRIHSRGEEKELFEKEEYLTQVYKNYVEMLKDKPNTAFIDAKQTPEQVNEQIMPLLKEII